MEKMIEFLTTIRDWFGISPEIQSKLFYTLIILIVLIFFRRFLQYVVNRFNTNVKSSYQIRRIITYTIFFIGLILIVRIWFVGFGSLATYFGLLSAGVAIALRDPIVNMAGWLFILFTRPFEVGDRIQIGQTAGDVIDLRLFQFTLNELGHMTDSKQSTGRIIHIPNSKVFLESQANYTQGFEYVWHEIPVLITFESDWQKAKKMLTAIIEEYSIGINIEARKKLRKAEKTYMLVYRKLTPKVYTDVKDSGINLTMRYLVSPYQRRDSQEQLWEEILKQFELNNDIDLAYPTIRYYNIPNEGNTVKRHDINTEEKE